MACPPAPPAGEAAAEPPVAAGISNSSAPRMTKVAGSRAKGFSSWRRRDIGSGLLGALPLGGALPLLEAAVGHQAFRDRGEGVLDGVDDLEQVHVVGADHAGLRQVVHVQQAAPELLAVEDDHHLL